MYIDSSDPMMEMLAAYHADKAAATASTTAAPAAAPVLKNPGEVKPREFPTCPSTTYEQAQKYGATPYTCGCPDRQKRDGGSYTGLDGRKACKHMLHMQRYYTDIAI